MRLFLPPFQPPKVALVLQSRPPSGPASPSLAGPAATASRKAFSAAGPGRVGLSRWGTVRFT